MKKIFALVTFTCLFNPLVFGEIAKAQSVESIVENSLSKMTGTISVGFEPVLTNGALSGCTLVYNALIRDNIYRNGAYLKVFGSIGIAFAKRSMAGLLKVVVNEVDTSKVPLELKPSPPSRAYLIDQTLKTNIASVVDGGPTDTPGAYFSVFRLNPMLEMVLQGLAMNQITIAFNSKGGSTDIRLGLELDVTDTDESGTRTRSPRHTLRFLDCLRTLSATQ